MAGPLGGLTFVVHKDPPNGFAGKSMESPSQVPSWSRHFASHDHIKPDCTSKVRFLFYPDSLRDLAMAFIFWTTHSHFAEFKVFELPHFPIWDMDRNPHSLNKMFGVLCIIPVMAHLTFMFDTWSPPFILGRWSQMTILHIYIYYVCITYVWEIFDHPTSRLAVLRLKLLPFAFGAGCH